MKTPTFPKILSLYLDERSVSKAYEENLTAVAFSCQVISQQAVNDYLKSRQKKVSPLTLKIEKRMILTLWRWAYDRGYTNDAPRGIFSFRTETQSTRAWTKSQLKTLLNSAKKMPGRFRCGAERSLFFDAWIRLGYETGARFGDLWRFRYDDIEDGCIRWVMHKTGDPMYRHLSESCLKSIEAVRRYSPDGLILGHFCKRAHAFHLYHDLCEKAGVAGTSRWLRRSGATHIEMDFPGKAKVFLGHRTHGLAEKSYIDHSQIQRESLAVPELG